MLVGDCPTKGRTLIGYESVVRLLNIEQGVIVMWRHCPCGASHLTATGTLAECDPERAAAGVRAARRELEALAERSPMLGR